MPPDKLVQIRRPSRTATAGWRSLDEGARSSGDPEFPVGAAGPPELSRRTLGRLLGASAILALGGRCQRDPGKLVPYAANPPDVTPGLNVAYATALVVDGYATGVLVGTREGRPIKIEGNPDHPASLGAAGAWEQASILQLYDPDRASAVRRGRQRMSWDALLRELRAPRRDQGRGLRLLLEPTGSLLVQELLGELRRRCPEARVTFWTPVADEAVVAGATRAFGQAALPQYHLGQAEVIVALDADLLGTMPFHLHHARHFAERRRIRRPGEVMNRLYVVECMPTITGSMADHRLRRRSAEIARLAAGLLAALSADGSTTPTAVAALAADADPEEKNWVQVLARDLTGRPRGQTLIVAGPRQPPEVQVLVHAINHRLGNLGTTVTAIEPVLTAGAQSQDLAALASEMHAGKVDRLVILEANPAYAAPSDLEWKRATQATREVIYVGPYENETARAALWFAPAAHQLESWGDARAHDGTLSLIQPVIEPLEDARTSTQVLAALAGDEWPSDRRRLRARFGLPADEPGPARADGGAAPPPDDDRWRAALARGTVEGTSSPPLALRFQPSALGPAAQSLAASDRRRRALGGLHLELAPSPSVHDGRFANNAWLLELPAPTTKLSWENAALLAPLTAARRGLKDEQLVRLELGGRAVMAPVLIVPGHAEEAVTVWLGYGRSGAERLAAGAGFDAFPVRTTTAPYFAAGLKLEGTGQRHRLARTQTHWSMHGRPIAVHATIDRYRRDPRLIAQQQEGGQPSFYPERPAVPGPAWAMSIDLSLCTGCGGCMVACQAENNVLVVGRAGVLASREMHWLRIDTYHHGPIHDPRFVHQPMMCQHCEKAPCEYVCPVNATVHSPDGLNEMIYNRCIGTRFCSNNCPYKVRRFNYFDWTERERANQGRVELQRNPEVTVRERGVMEKCTYCVQRIRGAEIAARLEARPLRPGDVVTACQQACPTGAIAFGSLTDSGSEVVRRRSEPRSYGVLGELGTRPRTSYLARLDNPNPDLAR